MAMKNKILTGLLGFFIAILIITFSIGLPIYFRPFFYLQIDTLNIQDDLKLIDEYADFTKQDIKDAFNEVMDYLTVPGNEFGTGVFPYSEEGKSHFVDCKGLFDLNITAFIISLIGFTVLIGYILIVYKNYSKRANQVKMCLFHLPIRGF